jgi:hypothetical protein
MKDNHVPPDKSDGSSLVVHSRFSDGFLQKWPTLNSTKSGQTKAIILFMSSKVVILNSYIDDEPTVNTRAYAVGCGCPRKVFCALGAIAKSGSAGALFAFVSPQVMLILAKALGPHDEDKDMEKRRATQLLNPSVAARERGAGPPDGMFD